MAAPDQEPGDTVKLLLHFVREMSWAMLIAHGLIAAFFFYGLTNALIKLSGHDLASFDFPVGALIGALSGALLIAVGAMVKLSQRD